MKTANYNKLGFRFVNLEIGLSVSYIYVLGAIKKMKTLLTSLFYLISISISAQSAAKFLYTKPRELNDGIKTSTLNKVGVNKELIYAATDSILKGAYPNIHSLLIIKDGKLVYENYFAGNDSYFGKGPIGFRRNHRDSLHDMRSISKTVIGLAVMKAIDQGKIKNVNQRVFDFLPEYTKYDTGTNRALTLKHLLTMSAGLDWDEAKSYADSTNSERRMTAAKDPVEYFLSQKFIYNPGQVFNYSGGCTQTWAAVVEKATGKDVVEYLNEFLFRPLGIKKYEWIRRPDGIVRAAGGLRMRSRDMAKLGLLYRNNGMWNNKQIISANLINESLKPHIIRETNHGYGYQLWIWNDTVMKKTISTVQADGNGGQRIAYCKQLDLIIIVTAGNYNRMGRFKNSDDLYIDFIYPSVIVNNKE